MLRTDRQNVALAMLVSRGVRCCPVRMAMKALHLTQELYFSCTGRGLGEAAILCRGQQE